MEEFKFNQPANYEPLQCIPSLSSAINPMQCDTNTASEYNRPTVTKPPKFEQEQKECENREEQDQIWKDHNINSQISLEIDTKSNNNDPAEQPRERKDNYTFAPVEKIKYNKLFQKFITNQLNKKNDDASQQEEPPIPIPNIKPSDEYIKANQIQPHDSPQAIPQPIQSNEIINFEDSTLYKRNTDNQTLPVNMPKTTNDKISPLHSEHHSKKATPVKKSPHEPTYSMPGEEMELKATSEHIENMPMDDERTTFKSNKPQNKRVELSDTKKAFQEESEEKDKQRKLQIELDVLHLQGSIRKDERTTRKNKATSIRQR